MTLRLLAITMAALAAVSCQGPTRGGVRPAPPGPIDLVRGVFGDFSGLCPKHYDFCQGGRASICCPEGGCCADENGPYCCSSAQYGGPGYAYQREEDIREHTSCRSRDITCSQGGRTICCSSGDSCCADSTGPYCCAPRAQTRTYDRYERYDDGY